MTRNSVSVANWGPWNSLTGTRVEGKLVVFITIAVECVYSIVIHKHEVSL